MTRRLAAMFLTTLLFASSVFAQTPGRTKEVKTVRLRIDGFMKSKSGAI